MLAPPRSWARLQPPPARLRRATLSTGAPASPASPGPANPGRRACRRQGLPLWGRPRTRRRCRRWACLPWRRRRRRRTSWGCIMRWATCMPSTRTWALRRWWRRRARSPGLRTASGSAMGRLEVAGMPTRAGRAPTAACACWSAIGRQGRSLRGRVRAWEPGRTMAGCMGAAARRTLLPRIRRQRRSPAPMARPLRWKARRPTCCAACSTSVARAALAGLPHPRLACQKPSTLGMREGQRARRGLLQRGPLRLGGSHPLPGRPGATARRVTHASMR